MAKTSDTDFEVVSRSNEYDSKKWVTPIKGLTIEGTLTGAFVLPNTGAEGGKAYRAAYEIDTGNGSVNVGEAAFVRCMREITIGTRVRITYVEKKKAKKGAVWNGVVARGKPGPGDVAKDRLKASYEAAIATNSDDGVPF